MNAPQPNGPSQTAIYERIARLEASVDHLVEDMREVRRELVRIRTVDFRILFGSIIATTLGIAAIMSRGFGWL